MSVLQAIWAFLCGINWGVLLGLSIWLLPIPLITEGAYDGLHENPQVKQVSNTEKRVIAFIVGVAWPIFFGIGLFNSMKAKK